MTDRGMNQHYLGAAEWTELAVFWFLGLAVIGILVLLLRPVPGSAFMAAASRREQRSVPWWEFAEVRLLALGLPLEMLWEVAQFPLYDVWHEGSWGVILYSLAHCTLGDGLILLGAFEAVALLGRDRRWYLRSAFSSGVAFTAFGVGYTVFSEIQNVRVRGTWGYTDSMPIVPVLEIGGAPLLQWMLIPPVLIWLMWLVPPFRGGRA